MKIVSSVAALIACAVLPAQGRADVSEISVTVKGVTCPVCTHSINIGLRSVAGVKTVRIALATRVTVTVIPQAAAWVDPARIIGQIALVGFQAKTDELMLHLDGDVSLRDGQLTLTLSDIASGPVHLILAPSEQSDSRAQDAATEIAALDAGLASRNAPTQHVQVEGWWRPARDRAHPAILLVTKLTLSSKATATADNVPSQQIRSEDKPIEIPLTVRE